uniref:peptidylprolyl isomerase n=1 Tax=mine drainage metagenome TaxID=410659 RepID=E6Q067_9ZZZZ
MFTAAALAGLVGCNQTHSSDVLATVNGKQIMATEVDRLYKENVGDTSQTPSPEQVSIVRLNILHSLIDDEILQQRATKLNLVATDEEVNAKLTDYKAPYTEEEFNSKLKGKNLTLDEFKRDIRRTLTRNKLINKEIESKITITDAEIANYYNQHKSEFNLIEPQYHLAEIIVTNRSSTQVNNLQNSKAASDADAKKKMQMVRNRLDSGEEFASVAMSFSEDPSSSSNGGDLGFILETPLKTAHPDVYAAVSKLKAGETTETLPLYVADGTARKIVGYAVYQLIEKRPAGQGQLSDPRVQQSIRQLLRDSHAQLLQLAYDEMLHDEAKVHNYLAEDTLRQGAR